MRKLLLIAVLATAVYAECNLVTVCDDTGCKPILVCTEE